MGNACSGAQHGDDVFHVPEAGFTIPVRKRKMMGWKRDIPDHRDLHLEFPAEAISEMPESKDLRTEDDFPIYEQGDLASSTANAVAAVFHFSLVVEGKKAFSPSRLFIYFNERSMENTVEEDSGSHLRDGIRSLHRIGVCSEEAWEYDVEKFNVQPPSSCYQEAKSNRCESYARVPQDLDQLKCCLDQGHPFVFGFVVLDSFLSEGVRTTGKMLTPQANDKVRGSVAVMAIGYCDMRQVFIVRHSWGESFGDKGYFYMPYAYIANKDLAADFWAIKFAGSKHGLFPIKPQPTR